MKANQSITFWSDGQEVTQEQIHAMERQRYEKVFRELVGSGVLREKQVFGGNLEPKNGLSLESGSGLSLEEMRTLLAATKERLGREKILDLYHDQLLQADHMWHTIAAQSPARAELQTAYVEVRTENISLYQFLMANRKVARKNNLYLPSMIHPEHYYFLADKGEQIIVETFGQYGCPTYMRLIPATDGYRPAPIDADTTFTMTGYTHLMHDDSDTKLIGMHQFKDKGDGMEVRLGVFLPKAAPREIAEGHKWHLMIEFNNCLHFAAEQKVGALQKWVLKKALRRLNKG